MLFLISYDINSYHNEGYNYAENHVFRINMDGFSGKQTESVTYSKDGVPMHKTRWAYMNICQDPALSDMAFFPWARCMDLNPGSSALDVYYQYGLYSRPLTCVMPSVITETSYVMGYEGVCKTGYTAPYTISDPRPEIVNYYDTYDFIGNNLQTPCLR